MNAQEAKEYAEKTGFVLGRNGKRVTATFTATGETFERGSYEALGNEMVRVFDTWTAEQDAAADNRVWIGAQDADTNDKVDPFNARNMLAIRTQALADPDGFKEHLALSSGLQLDVIAAAFNRDARRKGEPDDSYRAYVQTGTRLSATERMERATKLARKILRKENLIPDTRPHTHKVVIEYKTMYVEPGWTGRVIYCHDYREAVKASRIELSGPHGKNIARIEIMPVLP